MELGSHALQADSLPSEPLGKPRIREEGYYSFSTTFWFVWLRLFAFPFVYVFSLPWPALFTASLGFTYCCRKGEETTVALIRDWDGLILTRAFSRLIVRWGHIPFPLRPIKHQSSEPIESDNYFFFQCWHSWPSSASWRFLSAEVLSRGYLFAII